MAGGYGVFRGLNEGYNSYRDRERDIEDQGRREYNDAQQRIQDERATEQYGVQREQQEYQKGRRGFEEEAAQVGLEAAKTGLSQAQAEAQEWRNNSDYREQSTKLAIQNATAQLQNAGIQYEMNVIARDAAKGAEKYRGFLKDFMNGGTVEKLVDQFNKDDDETNDIVNFSGDEENGWEIEFENGRVAKFENRDAVALHVEKLSDPKFHQAYLLQQVGNDHALRAAAKKAAADSAKDNLPYQKDWQTNTYKATDRAFGKIKEGLVDFGEPGASSVSSAVNSIVNQVGALNRYQGLVNAEVTDRTINYAKEMLEMNPEILKKRAADVLERMPDTLDYFSLEEFPEGKPDEGTPEYDDAISKLVFKDRDEQIEKLRLRVLKDYNAFNSDDGSARRRKDAGSKGTDGNEIAAPTRDEADVELHDKDLAGTEDELAAGEDDPLIVLPPAKTTDGSEKSANTVGSPEYKAKLESKRQKQSAADARKSDLESKLKIDRKKDNANYRKQIGSYVKGSEFSGLPVERQYEILKQFKDALTNAQYRRARNRVRKKEGKRAITSSPYPFPRG